MANLKEHMNNISENIRYVGVDDLTIDLFEGQYVVPEGMAYNSYVIIDEKIAVMDTVDCNFTDEWLANIEELLGSRKPDYLIVQHMEPDHSASIAAFMDKYTEATIVSSAKAFPMLKNFYKAEYPDRQMIVGEGDSLSLGSHVLNFVTAPMVHWPEVIMTYEASEKVLFSADGFGKFGAIVNETDDWACEARRYYIGIVGMYGMQVQAVLKKAAGLDIKTIAALHGPVLKDNLNYYLDLYNTWSSYGVETEGVVICYTSVYGNTKKAAELLAEKLEKKNVKVAVNDLARCDMAEAVEDAFRYGKLVLASPTYNGEIFPFMNTFINTLVEHKYQNRTIGFIENGSWAPIAAKLMKAKFEKSKNITFCENDVRIMSALSDESEAALEALACELAE